MQHEVGPDQTRVFPDDLTNGFRTLGLAEGDRLVLHAALPKIGAVEGGAAMVLHRLLQVLGKKGTLLMPTFTSITRHSESHGDFTKTGCWCEGKESRHLPFIPELQPDREMGEIAHRLCSWPASRRSKHPAYSYVAVGDKSEQFVRSYSLIDPVQPLSTFLKEDPLVMTVGTELDSVIAIHVALRQRRPSKFAMERALTIGSSGTAWVEIDAIGCSRGFRKLLSDTGVKVVNEGQIGSARASLYSMKNLVNSASELLQGNPTALNCGRSECLSCDLGEQ